MSVYAVSDLHGHCDVFYKGLEKIGFSDEDELYVIGDAIDRGSEGIHILMHIKEKKNMYLMATEWLLLKNNKPAVYCFIMFKGI